ncbi:phospholipase D-like domain-containing protein [Gluconobacter japonicus]|uniref:phospholipase D-like domain-containing protein n=1 Tax=Gluconobacter japonicus TaxID=376620 RepID=UPI001B8AAAB4|nr:phospholipase D-like domain-containing protein [Gluconobacter japonicus]MBS1051125.1 hypothetical protein [Gluconobacter japonicus]
MPLAIILRTSGTTNIFRDFIVNILASKNIDTALLCSGFFQESFRGSAYHASLENRLAAKCATSGVNLTTVGIHNHTWLRSYREFRNNMLSAGVKINCFRKINLRWHAKIFIAKTDGIPCAGIIGSSNITRNAFSVGKNFNNECDVFLWSENSPLSSIIEDFFSRDNGDIIIRAPYLPEENDNLSLGDLLLNVENEVMSSGIVPL